MTGTEQSIKEMINYEEERHSQFLLKVIGTLP
jgi:hypothetical protein